MTQRTFFDAELRRLRSMPRTLWVVLIAGLAFLLANVMTLLSLSGLKIDPGTATLFGAIIGLCVVAWQTNKGFGNLIRSQENHARLEREARLHKLELDRITKQEEDTRERELLLSGLRAEMVALHEAANNAGMNFRQLAILHKAMHESNVPANTKQVTITGFRAPFYKEHIDKLGLLPVSLAADIIKVHSSLLEDSKTIAWETPAPNSLVALTYAGGAIQAFGFRSDLFHVCMRIRALEEGTADPGNLSKTREKRHADLPKLEDMVPKKML